MPTDPAPASSAPASVHTGEAPVGEAMTDPAWLPDPAFAPLGRRRVAVVGEGLLVETVRQEVRDATARGGGALVAPDDGPDLTFSIVPDADLGHEGFEVRREVARVGVHAPAGAGLLYGLHHVVRHGEAAFADNAPSTLVGRHVPAQPIRMLDHWDNLTVHPTMGQVERGYAGDSIFWADGRLRDDLTRVARYARLLAGIGINSVAVNNVNVHTVETRLITDGLDDVAQLAAIFRPYGIRLHLSVSFAAPMTIGGLATADPLDAGVQDWWAQATDRIYAAIPDFGGYLVKADSEGQPGPFAYGRDHADGANLLARALAPHNGTVFWRAFVYNHRQDWRDRSTDRARAAYDHFAPLDGRFDDNVVLQVKFGPIDFQAREPVSPVLAAMPGTRLAVELQVTQEYTGQQRHVCYLVPQWSDVLGFQPWGPGSATVADIVAGQGLGAGDSNATGQRFGAGDSNAAGRQPGTQDVVTSSTGARASGIVAVSNVGTDLFWTGHPLAQANLYGFGRLAWDPTIDPAQVLDEWITLTFGDDPLVRARLHAIMDDSWQVYERYTAPLGVGFMVYPGTHYGPDVDGYEYSPWGTYHFADRDGVGVDRTRATGTGYTGQYPHPWSDVYESLTDCPDEFLLFFHHVPYSHVLHSGSTVIQHIYDTHADGVAQVEDMVRAWEDLNGHVPDATFTRVTERLIEQLRCAREWRDQITSYFFRKSGVPDARGRVIH